MSEQVYGNLPRRVLFLADDVGGGTGNHLFALLEHWDRSRWRARVVSQARRYDGRLSPDSTVEYAPAPQWYDRYPLAQVRRLLQLRRSIVADPPDLVHTYFFWSIIYGRLLKRLGVIRALVENREDMGFSWGPREYRLLRLTAGIPDRVICVAEAVRQVVLERERVEPARVVVLRNGVEPVAAASEERAAVRSEFGLGDEHLVIGMVANLNRAVKGGTYFLEAIPTIVREVPNARFLIIGRVEGEEELRAKARALGIEGYLTLAGYRGDIASCYEIMDLSVLTSLSEGLSITLLESMNHGVPVVATRVGGNPEVVIEGETGFLVPPRDVPAFAGRVVQVLRDPALRGRMSDAARARIRQEFQIRSVAARYLDIYEDVFRNANPTG
ncbi:MAG: glycosyltransferase [Gemmatimonadota bacterium]|nr:MAG: glycosyltransferase [Gemmatimonadota bacterium]